MEECLDDDELEQMRKEEMEAEKESKRAQVRLCMLLCICLLCVYYANLAGSLLCAIDRHMPMA